VDVLFSLLLCNKLEHGVLKNKENTDSSASPVFTYSADFTEGPLGARHSSRHLELHPKSL
jgi:hypothetical protein